MSKKKPKAKVSTSVIFKPGAGQHPKIHEVADEGEVAAIVTRQAQGDAGFVNLHVFPDSRESEIVLSVPHSTHAGEGESCWKHR